MFQSYPHAGAFWYSLYISWISLNGFNRHVFLLFYTFDGYLMPRKCNVSSAWLILMCRHWAHCIFLALHIHWAYKKAKLYMFFNGQHVGNVPASTWNLLKKPVDRQTNCPFLTFFCPPTTGTSLLWLWINSQLLRDCLRKIAIEKGQWK